MASKLFGGMNLSEVAKQIKEKGDPSPYETSPTGPKAPAAELALTGRTAPMAERTNVFSVDPKRCRPWRFHNRTSAWYTKEACQDLIDSMPRDGQMEPALGRKLVGDADFDFELIYGLRRRFAAEFTHTKLKVRLTGVGHPIVDTGIISIGILIMWIRRVSRGQRSAMLIAGKTCFLIGINKMIRWTKTYLLSKDDKFV